MGYQRYRTPCFPSEKLLFKPLRTTDAGKINHTNPRRDSIARSTPNLAADHPVHPDHPVLSLQLPAHGRLARSKGTADRMGRMDGMKTALVSLPEFTFPLLR